MARISEMRRTHCVPDATLVTVPPGCVAHADNGTVSLTIYNADGIIGG